MVLPLANPAKSKDGVYYFIQRVPADLVQKVGKTRYSFSLGTKDPKIARELCLDARTLEGEGARRPPFVQFPRQSRIGVYKGRPEDTERNAAIVQMLASAQSWNSGDPLLTLDAFTAGQED